MWITFFEAESWERPAFDTEEATRRILDVTCENIAAFAAGEPRNTVPE